MYSSTNPSEDNGGVRWYFSLPPMDTFSQTPSPLPCVPQRSPAAVCSLAALAVAPATQGPPPTREIARNVMKPEVESITRSDMYGVCSITTAPRNAFVEHASNHLLPSCNKRASARQRPLLCFGTFRVVLVFWSAHSSGTKHGLGRRRLKHSSTTLSIYATMILYLK